MKAPKTHQKSIQVWADWEGMQAPLMMGTLLATPARGKEVFSFSYEKSWLQSPHARSLDPDLGLYLGPQYPPDGREHFGFFMDSCPDRWGRVLMQRREAQLAREEERPAKSLYESDYLLGVYDGHRMGGLRYKLSGSDAFLDDNTEYAAPPWTTLRELEQASLQLESEHAEDQASYSKWLKMLVAPGGSLGGARPKASILAPNGHPWIAKFPSRRDTFNSGKWEYLVNRLAKSAKLYTAECELKHFSGEYDTFLAKRFDRSISGERIHFVSAMTMLGKKDGDGGDTGVSYLDLADLIVKHCVDVHRDLEELWRRIVFSICVSNTDDHLRNHGFLLAPNGWCLSPAYDINPNPTGSGLSLNISDIDNSQNLALALSVAPHFRLQEQQARRIQSEIIQAILPWKKLASELKLPQREIGLMANAFRLTNDHY